MKVVIASVAFLSLLSTASAGSFHLLSDSSKIASTSPRAACTEILEANVVFPELLQGHEEASVEYIEKFSVSRRDYLIRMYNKSKVFHEDQCDL